MEEKAEMTERPYSARETFMLGGACTLAGLVVSFAAAGGGHGSYIPALLLFPYAMVLAEARGVIGVVCFLLMVIQFPAYFMLVSTTKKSRIVIAAIVIVHLVVASVAYLNRGDHWH